MKKITAATLAIPLVLVATLAFADQESAYEKVLKIQKANCFACHGAGSPHPADFDKDKAGFTAKMVGPRMASYEELVVFVNGKDTGALMRRLDDGKNTKDGKPGNMYSHLGADEKERAANLAIIKSWVGYWTLKRAKEISPHEKALIKPSK